MGKYTKADQPRPWDVLKCSKAHYLATAPWKRAGMKRKKFEALLAEMPAGFTDRVLEEAQAEELVSALFGKGALD